MSTSGKEYKSPVRKLLAFFEKSRDGWKAKCAKLKYKAKKLQQRVRYLSARNEELKQRVRELERKLAALQAREQETMEEMEAVKKRARHKRGTREWLPVPQGKSGLSQLLSGTDGALHLHDLARIGESEGIEPSA